VKPRGGFAGVVWDFYNKAGRHDLPWRKTRDPYRILVSEVMLQQTQVERVIPYYERFLRAFPSVEALAASPLSSVLRAWQGLGYNRRAKMLHEAAKQVAKEYGGVFPKSAKELEALRGVGPYTARAVAAFAFNKDGVVIETNIRAAVIHHFFPKKKTVSDKDIEAVLATVLPKGRAREWYSALMDYGAALKRSGIKTNMRMKGYKKQSRFDGSYRQARGAILRTLAAGALPADTLALLLGREREAQMKGALASLTKEGIVTLSRGKFRLAD
jgi:A/G-specific adenine glycosylase